MEDDVRLDQFLVIDRLPDLQRKEAYDQVRQGQVYMEGLHTREDHDPIHIPSGLINPLMKSIPRDVLLHTLSNTRDGVVKSETPAKHEGLSDENPVPKDPLQKNATRR